MFEAPDSAYLVPFDGTFKVAEASSAAADERHTAQRASTAASAQKS